MIFQFARRFALAAAAIAITVTTLVAPSSALAANIPAASTVADQSMGLELRPDLGVENLPMKKVNGKWWYMWKVTNYGNFKAQGVKLERVAPVFYWYNPSFKENVSATYISPSPIEPGQSIGVMLECPGTKYTSFCSQAFLTVSVTQGPAEFPNHKNWIANMTSTRDLD